MEGMPPLSSLGMLVFSAGIVGAAIAQLVPIARGFDWYSEEGARHMRRGLTIAGGFHVVAFGGGGLVTAIDEPAAAPWALSIGGLGLALGIAILVVAPRRKALDPGRREEVEGPAARRRLSRIVGPPIVVFGLVLALVVGIATSWPLGLGVGLPVVLLGLLFALLVRIDWSARARRRAAEHDATERP